MIRKLLLGVTVVVTAALGGLAGTALADEGTSAPSSRTIPAASTLYRPGMTLDQVADAASGQPGDVAPPCPAEDVVTRLKAANVEFGPCDPFPEVGSPIILPPASDSLEAAAAEEICPAVTLGKTSPLIAFSPCGIGAELLSAVPVTKAGKECARVSYIANDTSAPATAVVCTGVRSGQGVELRTTVDGGGAR